MSVHDPRPLTLTEWNELKALKEGININPACYMADKGLERFTTLLIKSLRERGG